VRRQIRLREDPPDGDVHDRRHPVLSTASAIARKGALPASGKGGGVSARTSLPAWRRGARERRPRSSAVAVPETSGLSPRVETSCASWSADPRSRNRPGGAANPGRLTQGHAPARRKRAARIARMRPGSSAASGAARGPDRSGLARSRIAHRRADDLHGCLLNTLRDAAPGRKCRPARLGGALVRHPPAVEHHHHVGQASQLRVLLEGRSRVRSRAACPRRADSATICAQALPTVRRAGDARIGHQRAPDGQHLLLAAGE